jgi:hypothetical protein
LLYWTLIDRKAGKHFANIVKRSIDGADTTPRYSPLLESRIAMRFDNLITIGIFPQKSTTTSRGGLQVFECVGHNVPPLLPDSDRPPNGAGVGLCH